VSCGTQDEDTLELTARFVEDSLGAEAWTLDFASGGGEVAITTGATRRPGAEPTILRGRSGEGGAAGAASVR